MESKASTQNGAAEKRMRGQKHLLAGVKLSVSIVLLVYLFYHIPVGRSATIITNANMGLVSVGGLLMFLQTGLSAAKWRILLRGQSVAVAYLKLLRTYLLANFINLFTPGFVGGDAYRSVSLRTYTGGVARSLPSVLVDRITGLVVLIALAVSGASLYLAPAHPVLLGASILLTVVIGYALLTSLVDPLIHKLAGQRKHTLITLTKELVVVLRPTKNLFLAFAIAVVFQTNIIFIVAIWSTALQLSASVQQLFLIVPAVYLLEILPISISGVGLREGSYTALFSFFGLPPEQGLALGLLTSLMRYTVGAMGALVWFLPE